ncbi:MAG: S1 family peptidase [Planctomycetota bacterium]|jgi:S1-C subfamily serine protease
MRRQPSGVARVLAVCLAVLGAREVRGEVQRCINNAERTRALTDGLASLLDAGRTVEMKTLIDQLDRRSCRLALAPPPVEPLTPAEIYRRRKDAVVVVGGIYKCKKCSKWHVSTASGFLITPDGIVVTNYHVVNSSDRKALGAMTYDGRVFPVARVLAADEPADIAIVKLDPLGKPDKPGKRNERDTRALPYLALAPDAPVGTPVWVISHPRTHFYTFTEGMVSGYFVEPRKKHQTRRMTITADFGKGSSGAPVLDGKGVVVGMVASTRAVSAEPHSDKSYAQMVLRHCVPVKSVRGLIVDTSEKAGPAAGR